MPPEVRRALDEVQPGRLITDMHVRSAGGRAVKGLREGLLPEESPFDDDRTHVVAATNTSLDPAKRIEVVALLQEIDDEGDKAEVTLDIRRGQNPALVRQLLTKAGVEFGIGDFIIDPGQTDVSQQTLDKAGFQDMGDGTGRQHFPVYDAAAA